MATAAALALTGAVSLTLGPQAAAPAAAAVPLPQCPADGSMPGIGNTPTFTDNNVAVYAGGDYTATGAAAESEGLLLVRGNATFDKDAGGLFNVGAVGVGSQIVPSPGSVMLAVGGDLVIAADTSVAVGANVDGGGAVRVGGTLTEGGGLDTTGGSLEQGVGQAAAMAPFADFQSVIEDESSSLAGQAATGSAERAGARVTLTGSGDATLQVFTITAADLSGASEVFFEGIPDGAAIAVNVVGGPVDVAPSYFSLNGARVDDFASPDFGNAASQILWNFADAASVTIGGSSQFMGSILAPAADADITASTNGRVYVGGDLVTRGTGNEQHSYPWIGSGTFGCVVTPSEVGGFSVAKAVTGPAGDVVPAGTQFTVEYAYELDGVPTTGTLTVTADGAVVDGPQNLPVGTVVTFTETGLPDVDGVVWGAPVFSPATVTIAAGASTEVTLTNTADAVVVDEVGGFSLVKDLTGPAAGSVPTDTEFTVEYAYELDGVPTTGTLTVTADGTVVDGPQNLPVGTVVTFTETDLPQIEGVAWGAPVFSPTSVTVGADQNTAVTLTNTAEIALTEVEVGGFSVAKAVTGPAGDVVPAGTQFTVEYAYELDGVPTTGTLTVTADGTVVDGPQNLPVGTVVTFTETDLPDVDGVVWGAPVFSPASVTIAAGANAEVTLTNTADAVVVDEVGGFSVAKAVTGPAGDVVPAGTQFTVEYAYALDGVPTTGTLTVAADGSVVDGPQNLPVGTVVTFTETDLPDVDGVVWGAPVFSPATVTIAAGVNAEVTLTNTADAVVVDEVGGFSLVKDLTGPAAGSVPTDTEFTVEYAYELDGVPTTGTLTVTADGTVVDGPQNLPVGTVVSFTETDLPDVDGVVWGAPVFSPETVTVTAGTTTEVTLTNTANAVATGGSSGGGDDSAASAPGGSLARTGVETTALLLAAALLVAAGLTVLVVSRRRSRA